MTGSTGPCTPRLLGAGDVRRLADRVGISPRKSLGQNFVIDANTIRRIVRIAGLDPTDQVLEVGPGLGSLTLGLLAEAGGVTAVELDRRLAAALPGTVAEFAPDCADRVRVLQADAAAITDLSGPPVVADPTVVVDEDDTIDRPDAPHEPSALVANLPYNVAVPVLLHSLITFPSINKGVVLVQTEVAERLAAGPGDSAYGVPSVKLAWFAEARMAGRVPAGVFWPVPRVGSSLVRFTRRPEPQTSVAREQVFALINAAFGQRRKTIRASLRGLVASETLSEVFGSAGLTGGERPEQLGLADFIQLAEAIGRLPT